MKIYLAKIILFKHVIPFHSRVNGLPAHTGVQARFTKPFII